MSPLSRILGLLLAGTIPACLSSVASAQEKGQERSSSLPEGSALARHESTVRFLCVGDAFTVGYGAFSAEGFPEQLQKIRQRADSERPSKLALPVFGGRESQVLVRGWPGMNTATLLGHFPMWLDQTRPHVVLILAGMENQWTFQHRHLDDFPERGWFEPSPDPPDYLQGPLAGETAATGEASLVVWRTGPLKGKLARELRRARKLLREVQENPRQSQLAGSNALAKPACWSVFENTRRKLQAILQAAPGNPETLDMLRQLYDKRFETPPEILSERRTLLSRAHAMIGPERIRWQSQFAGLLEQWEGLLAQAPNCSLLHRDLGELLRGKGDVDRSERLLRRSLELQPYDPIAVRVLSVLLQRKGDPSGALALVEEALRWDPGDPTLLLRKAQLLLDLHNGPRRNASRLQEALALGRQAGLRTPRLLHEVFALGSFCSLELGLSRDSFLRTSAALLQDVRRNFPKEQLFFNPTVFALYDDHARITSITTQELLQIAQLAQAAGAVPILQTYPDKNMRLNPAIREAARLARVDLIDHAALFDLRIQQDGLERYFQPDGHANAETYRIMAEQIAESLGSRIHDHHR